MKWARLKKQLLADKRKLGLMITLLAVGLLLWGRLLIKDVPRTAVADPDEQAAVTTAPSPSDASASTDKLTRRVVEVTRFAPVQRDLFAFEIERYPRAQRPQPKVDAGAKSESNPTDEQNQQQAKRLAVYSAARGLTLQSTLLGARNRALINGVLLEPGESILGFEVKAIDNRTVTLERDGIEVTLEM